jgi:spore coat protein U-like protein
MSNANTGKKQVWQADLEHSKDSVRAVPYGGAASGNTVAASASSVSCLAANSSRTALHLSNSSGNAFYGRWGTTSASTTDFHIYIPAAGSVMINPAPTDALQGIWGGTGGYLAITEMSA